MRCAGFAILLGFGAIPAWGGDQITDPGQGFGTVAIDFMDQGFSLSLAVPSADVVGFERHAEDDTDRARIAIAISALSKPLELFVVPEQAGCMTASANVTLTGEALGQIETGSEDAPQLVDPQMASEFQGEYVIQCQDMSTLDGIVFAYFDHFENSEALTVLAKTATVERAFEMTRATRVLDVSILR